MMMMSLSFTRKTEQTIRLKNLHKEKEYLCPLHISAFHKDDQILPVL